MTCVYHLECLSTSSVHLVNRQILVQGVIWAVKGETVLGVVIRQSCCFLVLALAYPDVEEKPVLYSHLWRSAVIAALGLGEVFYEKSVSCAL